MHLIESRRRELWRLLIVLVVRLRMKAWTAVEIVASRVRDRLEALLMMRILLWNRVDYVNLVIVGKSGRNR